MVIGDRLRALRMQKQLSQGVVLPSKTGHLI
jgi:hypothetical protein